MDSRDMTVAEMRRLAGAVHPTHSFSQLNHAQCSDAFSRNQSSNPRIDSSFVNPFPKRLIASISESTRIFCLPEFDSQPSPYATEETQSYIDYELKSTSFSRIRQSFVTGSYPRERRCEITPTSSYSNILIGVDDYQWKELVM
jgi:hypothetical protein